jgi:Ca2+-binding EF-hand superfamily protein
MMRAFLILLAFTLSGAVHAAEPQKQQAAWEDPYLARFQELDRDKDGYVSPGEWPLDADSFAKVDRNEDGRLARFELLTPNRLRRDWDPPSPPAPPRPQLERRAPARPDPESLWSPGATIQDMRLLRDLDRNLDNRLNRREWSGPASRFHRLDLNQDGVLSPRELSRN